MPAINFMAAFADDVKSGRKAMTIRAPRRDGRVPKAGDTLYLYTGMRSKSFRKIGEYACTSSHKILIQRSGIKIDGVPLSTREQTRLAHDDGFRDVEALRWYFSGRYRLPFAGYLIKWGDEES